MGFDVREAFRNVTWSGDDPQEQPLLVAELALWSAMSDGQLQPKEIETISDTIRQIPVLADFSTSEAMSLVEEMLVTFLTEDEIAKRIVGVATSIKDPGLRRMAYQLAVFCAASDGGFSEAENNFLRGLQEQFEISGPEAKKLIDEVLGA